MVNSKIKAALLKIENTIFVFVFNTEILVVQVEYLINIKSLKFHYFVIFPIDNGIFNVK